jgi:hypothetical protein
MLSLQEFREDFVDEDFGAFVVTDFDPVIDEECLNKTPGIPARIELRENSELAAKPLHLTR